MVFIKLKLLSSAPNTIPLSFVSLSNMLSFLTLWEIINIFGLLSKYSMQLLRRKRSLEKFSADKKRVIHPLRYKHEQNLPFTHVLGPQLFPYPQNTQEHQNNDPLTTFLSHKKKVVDQINKYQLGHLTLEPTTSDLISNPDIFKGLFTNCLQKLKLILSPKNLTPNQIYPNNDMKLFQQIPEKCIVNVNLIHWIIPYGKTITLKFFDWKNTIDGLLIINNDIDLDKIMEIYKKRKFRKFCLMGPFFQRPKILDIFEESNVRLKELELIQSKVLSSYDKENFQRIIDLSKKLKDVDIKVSLQTKFSLQIFDEYRLSFAISNGIMKRINLRDIIRFCEELDTPVYDEKFYNLINILREPSNTNTIFNYSLDFEGLNLESDRVIPIRDLEIHKRLTILKEFSPNSILNIDGSFFLKGCLIYDFFEDLLLEVFNTVPFLNLILAHYNIKKDPTGSINKISINPDFFRDDTDTSYFSNNNKPLALANLYPKKVHNFFLAINNFKDDCQKLKKLLEKYPNLSSLELSFSNLEQDLEPVMKFFMEYDKQQKKKSKDSGHSLDKIIIAPYKAVQYFEIRFKTNERPVLKILELNDYSLFLLNNLIVLKKYSDHFTIDSIGMRLNFDPSCFISLFNNISKITTDRTIYYLIYNRFRTSRLRIELNKKRQITRFTYPKIVFSPKAIKPKIPSFDRINDTKHILTSNILECHLDLSELKILNACFTPEINNNFNKYLYLVYFEDFLLRYPLLKSLIVDNNFLVLLDRNISRFNFHFSKLKTNRFVLTWDKLPCTDYYELTIFPKEFKETTLRQYIEDAESKSKKNPKLINHYFNITDDKNNEKWVNCITIRVQKNQKPLTFISNKYQHIVRVGINLRKDRQFLKNYPIFISKNPTFSQKPLGR
ncbi:hypothetical protein ACFLZV_02875 [Candidatus Margulisiibacteriota bacterium]